MRGKFSKARQGAMDEFLYATKKLANYLYLLRLAGMLRRVEKLPCIDRNPFGCTVSYSA